MLRNNIINAYIEAKVCADQKCRLPIQRLLRLPSDTQLSILKFYYSQIFDKEELEKLPLFQRRTRKLSKQREERIAKLIEKAFNENKPRKYVMRVARAGAETVNRIISERNIEIKRYKRRTKQEYEELREKIKELADKGYRSYRISKALKVSETFAIKVLKEINAPTKYRFLTDQEKEEIRRMLKNHYKISEIAKKLNRQVSTIYMFLKNENLVKPRKYKRLTEEDKNKIIKMHREGIKVKKIAEKLGRDPQVIYRFLRNQKIKNSPQ